MKAGDAITITAIEEGRTVNGTIIVISENQKSAVIGFDALLDGHVGQMPIMLDDDSEYYRSLITGCYLIVKPRALQ